MRHERNIRATSQLALNLMPTTRQVKTQKIPPEVRFKKMLKTGRNGCIEFTGAENVPGTDYGRFRVNRDVTVLAHRFAYEMAYGRVPELLRHTCHNPKCCRHDHLIPGTQQDNVNDMIVAGRQRTYLKKEQVQLIVKLHTDRGMSVEALAERFAISRRAIINLLEGRTWSKVTGIQRVSKRKTSMKQAA